MTTLTEKNHAGEFIVSELEKDYCRQAVVVLSGQNLEAGTVLGKVTATGKFAVYDNSAADGTEVAAGILLDAVDASTADADGVAFVRGSMQFNLAEVKWNTGALQAEIDAGVVDLAAIGIIAR